MSGGGGEQGGAMATRSSSVAHPLPAKGTVRGHTHRALHLPEPNRLLMEKQRVKSAPRGGIVTLLGMAPGLGPAVQALHGGHADLLLVVLHPVIQLLVELGEAGVMRDPIPSHCPSHPVPSHPGVRELGTHHNAVLTGAALPQRLQQLVNGSVGKPHRGGRWGQRDLEGTGTLTSCPQGASRHIPTAGELTSIPKY